MAYDQRKHRTTLFGLAISLALGCVGPVGAASLTFNVRDFGAHGDSVTDDTGSIQSTVNAAEAAGGGIVFVPPGNYLISSTISISSGVTVRGQAFQGNLSSFTTPGGSVPPIALSSLPACSCILQSNPTASTFYAVTTDAVQFQDLVIYYTGVGAAPYSGASGIVIDGGVGVGNSQSLIRDVLIYSADRGITFNNSASWVVNNDVIYNSQTYGLIQDSNLTGLAASAGDWQISNSTFAASTGNNSYSHVAVMGGGGGRIVGNYLNAVGAGNGIAIAPAHYVANGYNIEPMVITSNSIQGANVGINFVGAPNNDAHSTLGVINSNQIWANIDISSSAGPVFPIWINGWTISRNTFTCLGGVAIAMDGASGINITENSLYIANGGAQTSFGSNTSRIQNVGNTAVSGIANGNFAGLGAQNLARATAANGLIGNSSVFNVKDYGAKGDGATDDTQAIQNAINAAAAAGATAFIPAGKFVISTTLSVSSGVTVQGVGYQSAGTNFITTNGATTPVPVSSLRSCSCIIQTNPSASIFYVSSASAVQFLGLELYYPNFATPYSGAAGIVLTGGNSNSLIRDLFISGADRGITVDSCSTWVVDNVLFYNSQSYGLLEDSSGPAGSGDGWEIRNSTFETGTGANYSHIALQSGGGGRIFGNKLNAAGNGSQSIMNGIAVAPTHYATGGYQMNPVYIIGNSIEGEKVGIAFVGAPGNDGISSSGVIIGNQMWANTDIYSVAGPVFPTWVRNWTISGNTLNSQGGAGTYNINLDGASGLSITANIYTSVSGGTTTEYFGPNSNSISVSNNYNDQ